MEVSTSSGYKKLPSFRKKISVNPKKKPIKKQEEKYVPHTEEFSDKNSEHSDKNSEISDTREEISDKHSELSDKLSEHSDKHSEISDTREEPPEEPSLDSKYYEVTEGKAVFYLKVPEEVIGNWFSGGNKGRSLFICLDISGSMGEAITQAKEAILQIIEGLIRKGAFTEKDITCFFFNSNCRETRFGDDPNLLLENGEIRKYFDGIHSGGGTDFRVVFKSIIKNLDRIKNDLDIVFFTDGQNMSGELENAKTELDNALKGIPYTTEIHSVGFTKDHDARLLSWLTNCGSKHGNFIYVDSSEKILEKMKTTLKLLESKNPTLYIKFDQELLQANLDDDGNAMLILPRDSMDKQITIMKDLKGHEKLESRPTQIHADDPLAAKITTKYIHREIIRLMNEMTNLKNNDEKQEAFDKIMAEVEGFEKQLEVFSQIDPGYVIYDTKSIKSSIDKFKVILTEGKNGNLTNEAIAIFNDGLYKDITPQASNKKKITNNYFQRLRQDLVASYEQRKFCDVTIEVGPSSNNKTFKANSFILCIRSSYFHKELSSNGTDIDKHTVVIPDMLPKEFEILLKYIYTGLFTFEYEHPLELFRFLLAAVKFCCKEVVDILQPQLTKNFREWILENFRLVCDACKKYKGLVVLNKFCADDVIEEILKRFSSEGFEKIEDQFLVELLKSPKLKMDEFEIWTRVLKWGLAKHPSIDQSPGSWSPKDVDALFETFKDLIPLVRFFHIPKDRFFIDVHPCKKLMPEILCDDLIYYHNIPNYKPRVVVLPPRDEQDSLVF